MAAATAAVAAGEAEEVTVVDVTAILLLMLQVDTAVFEDAGTVVVGVLDTIEVPLTTGFKATMGKFCAAKRVVVAAPGPADKNPNPETGRGLAGVAEDVEEIAEVAEAFAAADLDFLTPLLVLGRGPYKCVFS